MPVDELLDLGRLRPAFEPGHGALALDQDQGRNAPDLEPLGELGLLVDVDLDNVFKKLDESRNHILSRGELLPDWAAEPMAAV